tara:strand:+ start:17750 stop:17899 length:150 start_codon:yes stop_codon:yes gene_type:complete
MGFNKPHGRQGAAEAATGIAPLKKYISQKAGSYREKTEELKPPPHKIKL